MNIQLNYENTLRLYNTMQQDKFFNKFYKEYERLNLYRMSEDWVKNKEYILKFKGETGDLIVTWN